MNYTVSRSIQGFILAINARRLSPRTIESYEVILKLFQDFFPDDPPLHTITSKKIQQFLVSQEGITKKTLLNYYATLSSLWTWALHEEIVSEHIVRKVAPPKPEKREILPLREKDIRDMMQNLNRSAKYRRPGQKSFSSHELVVATRNRAILLLLLDTGIRASELCGLRIKDADVRNHRIFVMGKGAKERLLPFSARTGQALWRYLSSRDDPKLLEPLFITSTGRGITRHQLLHMLTRLGNRVGVANVHPHRFRHTFAIQYLRNGGDPYSLQMMLGHSTLEMVKNYLKIAQNDLDVSHQRASPVDNWHL